MGNRASKSDIEERIQTAIAANVKKIQTAIKKSEDTLRTELEEKLADYGSDTAWERIYAVENFMNEALSIKMMGTKGKLDKTSTAFSWHHRAVITFKEQEEFLQPEHEACLSALKSLWKEFKIPESEEFLFIEWLKDESDDESDDTSRTNENAKSEKFLRQVMYTFPDYKYDVERENEADTRVGAMDIYLKNHLKDNLGASYSVTITPVGPVQAYRDRRDFGGMASFKKHSSKNFEDGCLQMTLPKILSPNAYEMYLPTLWYHILKRKYTHASSRPVLWLVCWFIVFTNA